ncbi:TIGR03013 family PEP-CTERM/XrtA system glycosyltransferase [Photobacterium makurazakiensis]|uniref:TIGR03013 family XrtA/PEP-CTERM system glycosyltransferase n=1 Tax=Photobacterium makurazakiensis TaxID=2910234 RepID=UPI003D096C8F
MIITDIILLFSIFSFGIHYLKGIYPNIMPIYGSIAFVANLFFFSLPIQITLLSVGLYNEKLRENFRGITVRITVAVILAYILSSSLSFFIPFLQLTGASKEILYGFVLIGLVFSRYIAIKNNYEHIGRRKVVVLGAGERAKLIDTSMRRKSDRVHFDLVGFITLTGDNSEQALSAPKLSSEESLDEFAISNDIDEIVIAADERRGNLPTNSLFNCKVNGISITDIIDFIERETGQIAVNHIYPSFVMYNNHAKKHWLPSVFHWSFNSFIAIMILIVTWPLIIAAIIAIKLEDGIKAPVFYSQQRVGLKGKVFSIYKFRSMTTDAEKNGVQMASKSDSRITRVGNILRKYRIDELPQLLNVFLGDMCFVGPRPERPQFSSQFENDIPYYAHRLDVKPGLTGWAQLKYPYGDGIEDAIEKLKFDLYYIKHRSLLLDILILIRTSEIVLFGKGR